MESESKTLGEKVMDSPYLMYALIILANVCGLIAFGLLIYWLKEYLGDFAFDDSRALFNYHPVFMSLGMVLLFGNSMVIFRILKELPISKLIVKIIHGVIHMSTILFIILGLYAVVERNNNFGFNDMYSFHSWFGVFTISLFVIQFIMGFVSFLLPLLPEEIKRTIMPIHRFVGGVTFILALTTVLLGLKELTIFLSGGTAGVYSEYPKYGDIANVTALFFCFFGILLMLIMMNPAFKRLGDKEKVAAE